MYTQELTLNSKLAEICKGTLTVFDSEPIPEVRVGEAKSFKMVGEEKLSEQEMVTHKKMRTVASVAANSLDVGITKIECVSVKGDILPAEFVLTYRFHLANFSDVDVAQVPVTIYFNLKGNSLVKQGSTTVSNIKAGHYQLVEFKFPAVEAGSWVMTLEANQPRAFAETNYKNNALSKNFVYTNQAELVAESISVVDANPKFDADGHQILFYDMKTTFEFTVSNIGSSPANGVLLQVPAAFQDATGAYPAMLSQGKMDLPAHTRRRAQLNITFTKPSTAQIGVVLNSDKSCPEINYDNNETHEVFSIVKYNPETGPEPKPDEGVDIDFSNPAHIIPGRSVMPLYKQNEDSTWIDLANDDDYWKSNPDKIQYRNGFVENMKSSSCGICSMAMIITYINENGNFTPADAVRAGIGYVDGSVASWNISSVSPGYRFTGKNNFDLKQIYKEIVYKKYPVIYRASGEYMHFVVISGYEFDPKKVGMLGYASDPYDPSHFRVMDPWSGRCGTITDVNKYYPTPCYVKYIENIE